MTVTASRVTGPDLNPDGQSLIGDLGHRSTLTPPGLKCLRTLIMRPTRQTSRPRPQV